jgi:hypothetical protein
MIRSKQEISSSVTTEGKAREDSGLRISARDSTSTNYGMSIVVMAPNIQKSSSIHPLLTQKALAR